MSQSQSIPFQLPQAALDVYRERIEEQSVPAIRRLAIRAGVPEQQLRDALWYERMRVLDLADPTLESCK